MAPAVLIWEYICMDPIALLGLRISDVSALAGSVGPKEAACVQVCQRLLLLWKNFTLMPARAASPLEGSSQPLAHCHTLPLSLVLSNSIFLLSNSLALAVKQ